MNNLDNIPKSEQKEVLSSFWTMLRECESKADDENDIILRHWVSCWYQQWNRLADDNKEPSWVTRARQAAERGDDSEPR